MTEERRYITDEEIADCRRLRALFDAHNAGRQRRDRLTQEAAGAALGMTQAALSNILNGNRPITIEVAAGAARLLGVSIRDFSPRLADEIEGFASHIKPKGEVALPDRNNVLMTCAQCHRQLGEQPNPLVDLAALATPRSRAALLHIATAAREGRLTDADLVLLEQIAQRFERTSAEHSEPDGSNTRLRERLRKDDPNAQQ